jgi:cysteine synthase
MILDNAMSAVGGTPMVELGRLAHQGLPGRVIAKLEMRNLASGGKDRLGVLWSMMPNGGVSFDQG